MDASHAMAPERLRANRQLRYATPAIRPGADGKQQDMEFCYPCAPTFLLPVSPAAQLVVLCVRSNPEPHDAARRHDTHRAIVDADAR